MVVEVIFLSTKEQCNGMAGTLSLFGLLDSLLRLFSELVQAQQQRGTAGK